MLGAGHEAKIDVTDLELKNSFSTGKCANHSIVMSDFMFEQFAAKDTGISFVHSSPGIVLTNIGRELPLWARIGLKLFTPILSPFAVSAQETGERQLFIATSPMFPPGKPTTKDGKGDAPETAVIGTTESGKGVRREVVPIAKGIDGQVGSGAYLVNWDGEVTGKMALLEKYRAQGAPKTIWEHTMKVFERVRPSGETFI